MERFEMTCYREPVTNGEAGLFFALLHIWNRAGRPEVFQAWFKQISTLGGLGTEKTAQSAKDKLIAKGVIHYSKHSNRAAPEYSFNALFGKENPLLGKKTSKTTNKWQVNGKYKESKRQVYGDSSEDKRREEKIPLTPKGEWEGVFPANSLRKSKTEQKRIKVLRNNEKMSFVGQWFSRKPETLWTVAEAKALKELDPTKEEVREMAAWRTQPYDYHRHDLLTLLNNWHGDLDKARSWKPNIENKQQQRAEGMRDLNSI